ncbi:MAG: lipopolysaccharide heptosyltransferase I [Halothiobacillaceae bacterium]|nr:MAG: lipopolysaccharide heptosyltransferase I [Halothiobacillaceae bacterium]
MRILIIKTSSLGDLVHMLPALTDAAQAIPGLRADWVAEEGFAAVPAWHPAVENIIPVAIRRWRRSLGKAETWREIGKARAAIHTRTYDAVIDSQGLLKSALLARWARGPLWGYDLHSIREPLAALTYPHRARVPMELHAIERNRRLLAAALGYSMDDLPLDYGLASLPDRLPPAVGANSFAQAPLPVRYIVALHGTSRADKEWPEEHWNAAGRTLAQHGLALVLPWGNAREEARARRIAEAVPGARMLPRLGLDALALILARAEAVLGVDTGLMHIAAALGRPGLALFPATTPSLTGVRAGTNAPPIDSLTPQDGLDAEGVSTRLLAAIPLLASPMHGGGIDR